MSKSNRLALPFRGRMVTPSFSNAKRTSESTNIILSPPFGVQEEGINVQQ